MKIRKWHFEYIMRITLFLLSFLVRIINIERGNYIVWDESHFNKFSKNYLLRQFYFDVHPPLGKLLNAFAGYLFNQDLNNNYESGDPYPKNMDYVNIRRFNAFFGAAIPIFAEMILKEFKVGFRRYIFTLFFIFENGFVSISRLILLDSYLLFFTAATVYYTTCLRNRKRTGWKILLLLGLSLGSVLSIKWIGAFVILLVGFYIIFDLSASLYLLEYRRALANFIRYAISLILLPLSIYILYFIIHFKILNKKSDETSYVNSLFPYYFENRTIYKYVDFGKPVKIKSNDRFNNYLHSHDLKYPNTQEYQITGYFHNDYNNRWYIQKISPHKTVAEFLKDGDEICLFHSATKSYLSLSQNKSVFSDERFRADGNNIVSDRSIFIVELRKDLIKSESRIKTLTSFFQLRVKNTNLYLRTTENKYPNWGGNQSEIAFEEGRMNGTMWTIETLEIDEDLRPKNPVYKELQNSTRFLPLFIRDLNIQMFKINNSFEQEVDEEPPLITSQPYEWFILKRGLRMVNWENTDRHKFYMFGNPLLWYMASIAIVVVPFNFFLKLRQKKKRNFLHRKYFILYISVGGFLLHYLPFFFINRVLYFHHYYPAYFFGLLNLSYGLRKLNYKILGFLTILVLLSYLIYSPLTYGIIDPSRLNSFRVVSSWNY